MRVFKIIFLALSILMIFQSNVATGQEIEPPSHIDKNNIFFGPGVINACKFIHLYPVESASQSEYSKKEIKLEIQNKNFGKTKLWIFKHLFKELNNHQKISAPDSEYCILLSTHESKSIWDTLLIIPVNAQTLGTDYKAKLAELKKIMTSE